MSNGELIADDPIWLILIKAVFFLLFGPLMTMFMIWFERRVIGRMQQRPGPNRAGPFGLLQTLADALKLPFKENILPAKADKTVYILAPAMSAIPAIVAMSVIPMTGEINLFGQQTALQLVELPVGLLVVLAASAVGVYGLLLGGWASGSPYPLLGSLRAAAQVISYELALSLSIVAVILYSRSLSTADIVDAQAGQLWFVVLLFPSFVVFVISMVGETNRAPFDLPEAESELVGGFHTEYSSMRFAMYFLAEYTNMVVLSAVATTLFLGGYHAPWPLNGTALDSGYWGFLWFFLKTMLFLFFFVWARAALPRMRYDQFMNLGWKVLVPVSLGWFVLIAAARALRNSDVSSTQLLIVGGIIIAALVIIAVLIPDRKLPEQESGPPVSGSDYPTPPLDLEVPEVPRRRRSVTSGAPARRRSRRADLAEKEQ